jgi:hypothetical protein
MTEVQESVFMSTVKCCGPNAVGSRAILEILNFYELNLQPDEIYRQANGELLPQAAALTACAAVRRLLGSLHGAVHQLEFDLRGELSR